MAVKKAINTTMEDIEHKLNLILARLDRLEARISKIAPEEGMTQGMTQVEVAKFLGVSVNYFKQHVRHQIPHKQADRKIIFSRSDVLAWLHGNKSEGAEAQ
ncbi:MAG: helix-turn-helix domain-containing protein [Candidatus Cloacimonetes bacterium]|nr:helix-turn-helix domain-containing protein [Candidatus Cloacimonadota bacterium]